MFNVCHCHLSICKIISRLFKRNTWSVVSSSFKFIPSPVVESSISDTGLLKITPLLCCMLVHTIQPYSCKLTS